MLLLPLVVSQSTQMLKFDNAEILSDMTQAEMFTDEVDSIRLY